MEPHVEANIGGPSPIQSQPQQGAGAKKNPSATEYALVVSLAGILGLSAVPGPDKEIVQVEGAAAASQMQDSIIEFRDALLAYRGEHANFPGYKAGIPGQRMRGPITQQTLHDQLVGWSDAWGNASTTWHNRYPLGPYLVYGIPTNPINGLDTILLIGDEDTMPTEPDGTTGWIYQPRYGDLRANCIGTVPVEGIRYFDL